MLSSSPRSFTPFLSSPPLSPSPRSTRISPLSANATASCSYTQSPPRSPLPLRSSSNASSLYEVLEIPHAATNADIKSAYRRLARICHPDVDRNSNSSSSSAEEFMKIHAAYCTLSDPEKRSVYDRRVLRRSHQRPLTVVTNSGLGGSYVGRNWETDQCW